MDQNPHRVSGISSLHRELRTLGSVDTRFYNILCLYVLQLILSRCQTWFTILIVRHKYDFIRRLILGSRVGNLGAGNIYTYHSVGQTNIILI